MSRILTIDDVPLDGKTVLVRIDADVPLEQGKVVDDAVLRAQIPTIRELLQRRCKVVIVGHLGTALEELSSLEPIAQRIAELLRRQVRFVDQVVGPKVKMSIKRAPAISVVVLENLAFDRRETANDDAFAAQLVADTGASYLVQDGICALGHSTASTVAAAGYIPNVMGRAAHDAYRDMTTTLQQLTHPVVVIVGDTPELSMCESLAYAGEITDRVIVAGKVANTLLAQRGERMGKSPVVEGCDKELGTLAERAQKSLTLPVDVGVGTSRDKAATRRDVSVKAVERTMLALDIGPQTVEMIEKEISDAGLVIWLGALGETNIPAFATGTRAVEKFLQSHQSIPSITKGAELALRLAVGEKIAGIDCLLDAPAKTVYTVEKNHKQVLS